MYAYVCISAMIPMRKEGEGRRRKEGRKEGKEEGRESSSALSPCMD